MAQDTYRGFRIRRTPVPAIIEDPTAPDGQRETTHWLFEAIHMHNLDNRLESTHHDRFEGRKLFLQEIDEFVKQPTVVTATA